jgi:transposase
MQARRSTRSKKKHTAEEKRRVLVAHETGDNWLLVAKHNGIPRTTAYDLVSKGRTENLPRGGIRAKNVKVTPAIMDSLEEYINENCDYTLEMIKDFVRFDHAVDISTSTISRKLQDMLYTVKQVWFDSFMRCGTTR